MAQKPSPGHLASALLDAKEFAQEFPGRLNRFLEAHPAKNEVKVRVDAIDETLLIEGLQKIANRIAMGVVLAALIVGAAIVMQIPTRLSILGYPALAVVLFAAAAVGGIALIVSIVTTDRKKPGSAGRPQKGGEAASRRSPRATTPGFGVETGRSFHRRLKTAASSSEGA